MNLGWQPRRETVAAMAGTCPRCAAQNVVQVDEGVFVCDDCLHEIDAPGRRVLPRRRRHEVASS